MQYQIDQLMNMKQTMLFYVLYDTLQIKLNLEYKKTIEGNDLCDGA